MIIIITIAAHTIFEIPFFLVSAFMQILWKISFLKPIFPIFHAKQKSIYIKKQQYIMVVIVPNPHPRSGNKNERRFSRELTYFKIQHEREPDIIYMDEGRTTGVIPDFKVYMKGRDPCYIELKNGNRINVDLSKIRAVAGDGCEIYVLYKNPYKMFMKECRRARSNGNHFVPSPLQFAKRMNGQSNRDERCSVTAAENTIIIEPLPAYT